MLHLWPWAGGKLEAIEIRDNVAHLGGGISLDGNLQPVTMVGLIITGNTSDRGGAVAVQDTTFSFDRALIAGNTAFHEEARSPSRWATGKSRGPPFMATPPPGAARACGSIRHRSR